MKKYCNKRTYLIGSLVLVVLIYFVCLLAFGTKNYTEVNKPVSEVLTKQPRLEDDFYDNINYKYLSQNQLEEDFASDQMSLKEYVDPFTGNKNK